MGSEAENLFPFMVNGSTPDIQRRSERLRGLIPRYKSGERKGQIRNERLREIDAMLEKYQFTRGEFLLLEQEIRFHIRSSSEENDDVRIDGR